MRLNRSRLLLIAACLSVLLAIAVALAVPARAQAKIKCADTGPAAIANVDPLMHHNEPVGSGHLHQIFGNTAWVHLANPNTANYADLVGKSTGCRNAADTAGYWQPVVIDTRTGKPLPVHQFTAYYRSFDSRTTGAGAAFPPDTRLVAMQDAASPGAHGWSCGQFESIAPQATIPDCSGYSQKPGHVLTAHINFPSCWDGVAPAHRASDVGNTTDNAHYRYPVRSGKSWVCPAGFGTKMVQLRETVTYPNPDKVPARYLGLTSDAMMGGHNGSTMHGDFWNAWVQSGLESMVAHCVAPGGKPSTAECG